MNRIATAALFLLCTGLARAQEEGPPPEGGLTVVIIFAVLFVGLCVGLVWFIWKQNRSGKASLGGSETDQPKS